MKKILSSTIAAGLVLGTTLSAAAQTSVLRDGVQLAQAENFGGHHYDDEDNDYGGALWAIVGAAIIAGVIVAIESGQDQDAPTSP